MGPLKEEENMAPVSFPLRPVNEGGKAWDRSEHCTLQLLLAPGHVPEDKSTRSPGQWVPSTPWCLQMQVFPGSLGPSAHGTLLAENAHKQQGSAGTGLAVQAA